MLMGVRAGGDAASRSHRPCSGRKHREPSPTLRRGDKALRGCRADRRLVRGWGAGGGGGVLVVDIYRGALDRAERGTGRGSYARQAGSESGSQAVMAVAVVDVE